MRKALRFSPIFAFAVVSLLVAGTARTQSQEDSVAAAARRAREQKKNAKPVKTLTNDDLPSAAAPGPAPSATPQAGAAADAAEKPAKNAAPGAPADAQAADVAVSNDQQNAKDKKTELTAALQHAKKNLAQAEKELDVLQRKQVLDSDSYYSKGDFANDKQGKDNLDAQAQQITDKQKSVALLKAHVAELQAQLGETPGDTSDTSTDKTAPQP